MRVETLRQNGEQNAEAAAPPPPVQQEADEDRDLAGKEIQAAKLVARVVDWMAEGVSFGATQVAAEINRRYRDKLRRRLSARDVSVTLRRLHDAGRLRLVRKGRSNHEALYAKRAPASGRRPAEP